VAHWEERRLEQSKRKSRREGDLSTYGALSRGSMAPRGLGLITLGVSETDRRAWNDIQRSGGIFRSLEHSLDSISFALNSPDRARGLGSGDIGVPARARCF
jgi:hypothetical protein